MHVLLPATFLLDSDGKTIWGHVRAVVENNVVARVELARGSSQDPRVDWKPFCELTVVEGRLAFRIIGNERTGVYDHGTGRVTEERSRS